MALRPLIAIALALSFAPVQAAEDPADVAVVVAEVKKVNPDFKALCQKGRDGITKAVTEAAAAMMSAGKLKGSPQAVGPEAGQQIGKECRGG